MFVHGLGNRLPQFQIILIATLAVAAACGPTTPAPTGTPAQPAATAPPAAQPASTTAAKPATRKLTWLFPNNTPSGGFYAFFVARDLGFWAEEGLEVEFKTAGGSGAAIQQLIAGQVDAGIPSTPATLNALSKDQKLKTFYQFSTGTLFFLKVPQSSPITSIKEFKDKSIGITEPGGGEVPMIKSALKGAGLDPDKDVRLIPVGEGSPATFEALKSGKVDAYSSNFQDTLAVELAGLQMRDLTPAEFNAFPAQMMIVTPESLAKNREALMSLARGVAKGTLWCQNKKTECAELIKNAAKEQWADPRVGQATLDNALKLTEPKGSQLGTIDRTALNNYLTMLKESDPEFKVPNVDEFVVDDMVAAINQFDRNAVLQATYKP